VSSLIGQSVKPEPRFVSAPTLSSAERARSGMLFSIVLVAFLFLIVVLPNSLRPIKLALFPAIALYCLTQLKRIDAELMIAWVLIAITSLIYLIYPPQPDLTPILFAEIGFVFVASPLFWILICEYIVRHYPFEIMKRFFFWSTFAALATIVLFYYLFLNYGPDAVSVFIVSDRANVELDFASASFGATMHVFGSLIFIGPAFIASETLGFWRKSILFLVLVVAALLSGRDAFLLCLAIGVAIYLSLRIMDVARQKLSLMAIAVLLGIIGLFFTPFGMTALGAVIEKIQTFGGPERKLQFDALMAGVNDDWLLGAGHTGHVDYIRDPEKPWRYEILPLATLYRVGLIGFLIYCYPVLSSFWRFGQLVVAGRQDQVDLFFFVGLLATMVATTTNPYLASFEFQWCLFLPYCYFRYRTKVM
jgi:hypothetical protein